MHKALRLLRVFRDMTQAELADSIGVSKSYLSELETGKKRIDMDLLSKYGEVFGLRPSTIVMLGEGLDEKSGKSGTQLVQKLAQFLSEVESEGTRTLRHSE